MGYKKYKQKCEENLAFCYFHLVVEESQVKCFSKISTKEEYLLESLDNHPF